MKPDHRSRYWRVTKGWMARVVVLCAIQLACAAARAGESEACCSLARPQDQLWLVSSRGVGCGDWRQQVEKIQYWRYDRAQSWTTANLAELLATDEPNAITTIFIHGNRISHEEAFSKGWSAYRALLQCADERAVRFVIWSWPSEEVRGAVNDARVKAWRTDPAAFCLAWFVDRLSPDVPVSLWGHSFGARIATGALHLLGGAAIQGRRLDERQHPDRQPMQVVLVAAALDNHWLIKGHCHGEALSQVASMLLVNNACDALLKRYHLIYADRGREQALGYTGINASWLPATDAAKIHQIDACCEVGKRHAFDGYLAAGNLLQQMRSYLLFSASDTPALSNPQVAGRTESNLFSGARPE